MVRSGFVYMMTNKGNTSLYTGVTSDLFRRVFEHKNGNGGYFTKRYNCTKLVYFAESDSIVTAIDCEKKIKAGSRKKKDELISIDNADWRDLAADWYL